MHLTLQSGGAGNNSSAEIMDIPVYSEQSEYSVSVDNATSHVVSENGRYLLSISLSKDEEKEVRLITVYLNEGDQVNVIGKAFHSGRLLSPETLSECLNEARIFQGQVDVVRFCVCVEYSDKNKRDEWFYSGNILCAFEDELDAANVRCIIEQLLSFDDDYINDILYAKSQVQTEKTSLMRGDLQKCSFKSLSSYIDIIKRITITYHRHISYFRRKSHNRVLPSSVMTDGWSVSDISPQTVNWLSQNMEMLVPVMGESGIRHGQKSYFPVNVESCTFVCSRNVHENQVVLGFLKCVLQNANRIIYQVNQELNANDSFLSNLAQKFDCYREGLPKPPIVMVRQLVYSRHAVLLEQLSKLKNELVALYSCYKQLFSCEDVSLLHIPRMTKVFLQRTPYREIYEHIIKWFNYGELCLSGTNYLFRVKKFTKVFEYYCLLRLIKKILDEKFVLCDRKSYSYEYPAPDYRYKVEQDLCNTYCFKRADVRLTLYYEPVLYGYIPDASPEPTRPMPNNLGLVRSCDMEGRERNFWEPDFVLKIEHQSIVNYAILDAKFSSTSAIYRTEKKQQNKKGGYDARDVNSEGSLPGVIKKYYTQTAALEDGSIRMVWTLQGRSDARMFEYDNLLSKFKAYRPSHSFGNCPVNSNPDIDCLDAWWKLMQENIPALQYGASYPLVTNENAEKLGNNMDENPDKENFSSSKEEVEAAELIERDKTAFSSIGVSVGSSGVTQQSADGVKLNTKQPFITINVGVDFCYNVWKCVHDIVSQRNLIGSRKLCFNERPPIRKDTLLNVYKVSKLCSISMQIAKDGLKLIAEIKEHNAQKGYSSISLLNEEQQEKCEDYLRKEIKGKLKFFWSQHKQLLTLEISSEHIYPSSEENIEAVAEWFVDSCCKCALVLSRDFRF